MHVHVQRVYGFCRFSIFLDVKSFDGSELVGGTYVQKYDKNRHVLINGEGIEMVFFCAHRAQKYG